MPASQEVWSNPDLVQHVLRRCPDARTLCHAHQTCRTARAASGSMYSKLQLCPHEDKPLYAPCDYVVDAPWANVVKDAGTLAYLKERGDVVLDGDKVVYEVGPLTRIYKLKTPGTVVRATPSVLRTGCHVVPVVESRLCLRERRMWARAIIVL